MNRIQARSPFLIKHSEVDLVDVVIRLYVYTGTQDDSTDRDAGYLYQATLTPVNNSDEVVFDASDIIDSILDVEFDGTYASQIVWVDYDITATTDSGTLPTEAIVNLEAYSGFRYFEEGAQNLSRANDTNKLLMTDRCVYKGDDAVVRIPVIADTTYNVQYVKDGRIVYTDTITSSIESNQRINYVSNDDINGVDNYKDRVLTDGGTYEESYCLLSFLDAIDLYDVDYILIDGERVNIKRFNCSKHNSYKITFINKFGALQDVYFDGKSSQTMKIKSESQYRRNTLVSDGYSINQHTNVYVDKNGMDEMKLSTGFVSEDVLNTFKELGLSKKAWIEKDGLTLPVNIKDETFKYKTSLNDKLISYTVTAELSFNSISNIR